MEPAAAPSFRSAAQRHMMCRALQQLRAGVAAYSNPDDARSDMSRSMLQCWLGKCGDIPERDDLDPADLKPLLPPP